MTPGAWMDGLLGRLRTAGSSVEHVRYHLDEDTMADDFDLLLDPILDDLERRAGVAS